MSKFKHWVIIALVALAALSVISFKKNGLNLGLDLKGGSVLTYRIDTTGLGLDEAGGVMSNTVKVLRKRLDSTGLGEISIEKVGTSSLRISLPGREQSEVEDNKDLLQKLGKLEFRIVAQDGDPTDLGPLDLAREKELRDEDPANYLPPKSNDTDYPGFAWYPWRKPIRDGEGKHLVDEEGKPRYETVNTLVRIDRWDFSGDDLEKLSTSSNPKPPHRDYVVNFAIKDLRENDFGKFTGPNSDDELGQGRGRLMAIILDGTIDSAPSLRSELTDGGFIEGGFGRDEAEKLIDVLLSGSLEVKPVLESEYSVGPSLGEDAINKGITAILIGFVLVVLVLIYYYLVQGLIANLALLLNLGILVGVLSFLGAALTLPGLAGIVLTVGMAVDANILICERIREEQAKGKTLLQSVKNGYDRAFLTILDANLTTVITAWILYTVGTGPVQGFAITLIVGILASMFTALAVSRLIIEFLLDKGIIKSIKFTPLLFGERSASYMRHRPLIIGVSLLLVVSGAFLFYSLGDEKLDIDFTGGAEVRMQFREQAQIDDVRSTITKAYPDAVVVSVRSDNVSEESPDLEHASDAFTVKSKLPGSDEEKEKEKRQFTKFLRETFADRLMPKGATIRGLDERDGDHERNFVGGNLITLNFRVPIGEAGVRDILAEAGEDSGKAAFVAAGSWSPTDAEGTVRTWNVYLNSNKAGEVETVEAVVNAVTAMDLRLTEPIPATTFIGSLEAETISNQALMAILYSLIAQILYIAFRFKGFSFGFAAVIALVHDVAVTLGVVALMDMTNIVDVKINLPIIAAFLTLIGYSMNDTIVVFDRIRENRPRWKGTFSDLIDASVNQNLARTIRTSVTTFIVLAVIFVVNRGAGSVLEGFSFVMLVGVVTGTYSSIFIASPMLMFLPWFWKKVDRVAPGGMGKVVLFVLMMGIVILVGVFAPAYWQLALALVICGPVLVGMVRWIFISDVDRAMNIAIREGNGGGPQG